MKNIFPTILREAQTDTMKAILCIAVRTLRSLEPVLVSLEYIEL
jgi:hypothetical protein